MFLINLKNDFLAYQVQCLGLYTKQKNDFLNNETNSFLGTLSVHNHVFCAHKKWNHRTAQMTEWTTIKIMPAGGAGSIMYTEDWKPFTTEELRQHFGLYVLQGFTPSPPCSGV